MHVKHHIIFFVENELHSFMYVDMSMHIVITDALLMYNQLGRCPRIKASGFLPRLTIMLIFAVLLCCSKFQFCYGFTLFQKFYLT